jgi:hypothetical protein
MRGIQYVRVIDLTVKPSESGVPVSQDIPAARSVLCGKTIITPIGNALVVLTCVKYLVEYRFM